MWIPSASPAVFELHQDVIAAGGADLVGVLEDEGLIASIGRVTIVTVSAVTTSVLGNVPAFGVQKLIFTPEPGMLLLGSGVVGLGVYGRRRVRK